MQVINAISLSPAVDDWLTNTRQPRMLHVFDKACNLINEAKEVLSLVTTDIGNGPFNLVVPRLRKSAMTHPGLGVLEKTAEVSFSHINLESPVSNTATGLHLGDFGIQTAGTKLWDPSPDWGMMHGMKDIVIGGLKFCLSSWKPFGLMQGVGFGQLPDARRDQVVLTRNIADLCCALASNDLFAAQTAASKLAGLGQGLTPACDDFMMGALYAAWIIHPHAVAEPLARAVANTAAPLTTSLSAAWLRAAGRGEAGDLWHEFFETLITSDRKHIQSAMNKIEAVGATSGTDALAGFIITFISYTETGKKHVVP